MCLGLNGASLSPFGLDLMMRREGEGTEERGRRGRGEGGKGEDFHCFDFRATITPRGIRPWRRSWSVGGRTRGSWCTGESGGVRGGWVMFLKGEGRVMIGQAGKGADRALYIATLPLSLPPLPVLAIQSPSTSLPPSFPPFPDATHPGRVKASTPSVRCSHSPAASGTCSPSPIPCRTSACSNARR